MKNQFFSTVLASFCLSLFLSFTACSKKETVSTAFEVVDVQPVEAAKRLKEESIVVLDVRTPQEVALGRIPGSININIADPDFAVQVAKLDSSKTYMVHCAAGAPGGRSRRSIEVLESAGVHKIYHLDGGFNAWKAANEVVEVPTSK